MNEHNHAPALAANREDAPLERVVDESGRMGTISETRWKEFQWIRDQARGSQRALVIGGDATVLAVLLAREGAAVTALDSGEGTRCLDAEPAQGDVDADRRHVDIGPHHLAPLDGASLEQAFAISETYDAVIITDGYRAELQALLRDVPPALVAVARIILAVPFGVQAHGDIGAVFPRAIFDSLKQFSVDHFELSDGRIRAVLTRGVIETQSLPPGPGELLSMTEAGAADELGKLLKRIPELENELEETRTNWADAERQVVELRESTSFQLGLALVMAMRSPRALLQLPLTAVRILRGRNQRTAAPVIARAHSGLSEWQKESLRNEARKAMDHGPDAVRQAVETYLPDASPSLLAFAHLVAAQACGAAGRHDIEFQLASHGLELNRSVGMLRGYLHVALRCREMQAASDALREVHEAAGRGNKIAKDFLRNFRNTSSYKIAALELIPPKPEQWAPVEEGRFVYVLHNSLPYSSGGYATRSHGVAIGLKERGLDVVCVTRPGFPLDVNRDLAPVDTPPVDVIDGVPYQRLNRPSRENISEYRYIVAAANSLEPELRRLKPAYIQAASNYVTGLPALVAARRIGVPFFYEVRGLWEITRMSRDQAFGESISFDVQRHIEGTLAREADHVFTLTEPMREELITRGVAPERITLLPNSVDADRFLPRARDQVLADELGIPAGVPVIGYVGTFVIYEGLEHLVEACVQLHQRGHDFRLLLVGNENASGQERGPITEEVLRIAREGGIETKLILPGRIPHEQVEAYYSVIDVCPFPRKPWPVCEMVSPLKPLEALAMKKAVVVSSVRALTEMIADDVTGLVFEKGNVADLAAVLEDLIADPEKRARLGEAGRDWVVRERSWKQVADRIEIVLQQFAALRAGNGDVVAPAMIDQT